MESATGQGSSGSAGLAHPGFSQPTHSVHQVSFRGQAGEYFRIWIVNMLLSLLTLGIYSAWATVRNRRYLYGNAELDGDRFDFHGKPLAILRGRMLAVMLFAAYAFGGDFHPVIPIVALLVVLALFPWILVKAMRFRLSNTSWRNLRLGFLATTRQAYTTLAMPLVVILLGYGSFLWFALTSEPQGSNQLAPQNWRLLLAVIISLFLASFWIVPALHYRVRNLVMNSVTYGEQRFHADIQFRAFLIAYSRMLGMAIVVVIAVAFLMTGLYFVTGLVAMMAGRSATTKVIATVVYIAMILAYLFPFAVWRVLTTNHVISATQVREVNFDMRMEVWAYWWLLVSNAMAAVVTLGLAIPWAKIRMLRYKLSCMSLDGDVSDFTGMQQVDPSAVGDEIGDAFDIDLGF